MMVKLSAKEKKKIFKYFKERFNMEKSIFDKLGFYKNTKGIISVGPKSIIQNTRVVSSGISILRMNGELKPTTAFFQTFGKYVKKNFIELNRENAIRYISGEDLFIEAKDITRGYVMIMYKEFPLGCSSFKNNKLKNMIPKSRRIKLEYI